MSPCFIYLFLFLTLMDWIKSDKAKQYNTNCFISTDGLRSTIPVRGQPFLSDSPNEEKKQIVRRKIESLPDGLDYITDRI